MTVEDKEGETDNQSDVQRSSSSLFADEKGILRRSSGIVRQISQKSTEGTLVLLPILDIYWNIYTGIILILAPKLHMLAIGIGLIVAALLPWWPYAISDLAQGEWCRALIAFAGFGSTLAYKGIVASPEFEFFVAVLGALPRFAVLLAGALVGLDLLFQGPATPWSDWLILIAAFLNGLVIAPAAGRLYYAGSERTSGWIGRYWMYIVYAADMVSIVAVVGSLGAQYKFTHLVEWLTGQWIVCGVWPALSAPLPMPTLRPSVPTAGWQWFAHRAATSVVGVFTVPPLEYVYALPSSERWVWPFAALLRTILIVITVPVLWHHACRRRHAEAEVMDDMSGAPASAWKCMLLAEPSAGLMDLFVFAAVLVTAVDTAARAIRLLLDCSVDSGAADSGAAESSGEIPCERHASYGSVSRSTSTLPTSLTPHSAKVLARLGGNRLGSFCCCCNI